MSAKWRPFCLDHSVLISMLISVDKEAHLCLFY